MLNLREFTLATTLLLLILSINTAYHILGEEEFSRVLGANTFGVLLFQSRRAQVCTTENSLDVLISKRHGINPNFEPEDLVEVGNMGVRSVGAQKMRAEALSALKAMFSEMDLANLPQLAVLSGFRSYERQKTVKKSWLSVLGISAEKVSADAGHSEHQLGTTVDFSYLDGSFINTADASWQWLNENAHEYGFVMTYRQNNQKFTGYDFEPWHWRYVGKDLATEIYTTGRRPERMYQALGCR